MCVCTERRNATNVKTAVIYREPAELGNISDGEAKPIQNVWRKDNAAEECEGKYLLMTLNKII